jgi:hypothetical protein
VNTGIRMEMNETELVTSPCSLNVRTWVQMLKQRRELWCVEHLRLCGLVVRIPDYRSWGPGSIPGTIKFSEK